MLTALLPSSMRAEHPLARAEQPVDDRRGGAALLFQPIMLAREDAVSAVSLPEKNADSIRQSAITRSAMMSST